MDVCTWECVCVCMHMWRVDEKNVHSYTSLHANKCTQKSIYMDARGCTGSGSTYRSQRACPGWFPASKVSGDIHPSQLSHSRVTHEKNESRFRPICAWEYASDALSPYEAVKYLQNETLVFDIALDVTWEVTENQVSWHVFLRLGQKVRFLKGCIFSAAQERENSVAFSRAVIVRK